MENIVLKDSSMVVIGSNRDITEAIAENMGYEFSDLVERRYTDDIEELKWKAQAAEDEKENYENSLVSKDSLLHDTLNSIDEIMNYMRDAKRIDKEKIFSRLQNIHNDIWSQL